MSSFVIRTYVKDLIVSIENVECGIVDIFIHGMTYLPGTNNSIPSIPTFYLEHCRRGVHATLTDILAEVERGVNYHFILNDTNKKEFKEWLEARLNEQDIY